MPKQTPLRTPTLQTCCSFRWVPALCNQAYFLQGHPALPMPADFPTWESLTTLEFFPYGALCLSSSRVWVSQIMMCSGFACEILHNSIPIVRLGQAVRPYSAFSLHNVCESIRRKPEQWDDSGWLGQALLRPQSPWRPPAVSQIQPLLIPWLAGQWGWVVTFPPHRFHSADI